MATQNSTQASQRDDSDFTFSRPTIAPHVSSSRILTRTYGSSTFTIQSQRPAARSSFRIAIVCALQHESSAVRAIFDDTWDPSQYGKAHNDPNTYTPGRIGEHNVVLAYLPGMGGPATSSLTAHFLHSYPSIDLALVVGICGGAPIGEKNEPMGLGDVVISDSIVQYTYGSRYPHQFRRKDTLADSLARPKQNIRSFLHMLQTLPERKLLRQRMLKSLELLLDDEDYVEFKRPDEETNKIFKKSYRHKHQEQGDCKICDRCTKERDDVCDIALKATCLELSCDSSQAETRTGAFPTIHFGKFASGDQVMKSAVDRDIIVREEQAIAFETEGAGAWDNVSTIIIKSVCDFADSHKNDDWQNYASAVAACCMKALLGVWTETDAPVLHAYGADSASGPNVPPFEGHFYVPNRLVRHFLGREDVLASLDNVLCSSRTRPVVAVLRGLGGQGKSQTALKFCEQKRRSHFHSIFWLEASTETSLRQSVESVAAIIGAPLESLPSQELRVLYFLQKLAEWPAPWLLVLDNYDDPCTFPNIQDYIPSGPNGAVLLTTRHSESSVLVENPSTDDIILHGLDDRSAVALLLQRSGLVQTDFLYTESLPVVRRLGMHPLAITQAGAYMRSQKIGVDSFLEHYKRRQRKILETMPQLSQYRRKLNEDEKETFLNVFTTWELSYEQLRIQTNSKGVEIALIALLSLFESSDVSEELFHAYPKTQFKSADIDGLEALNSLYEGEKWNEAAFTEAIASIEQLSLMQISSSEPGEPRHLSLHPLVRDWIRLRTDPKILGRTSHVVTILLGAYVRSSYKRRQFNMTLDTKKRMIQHILSQVENWTDLTVDVDLALSLPLADNFLTYQDWMGDFCSSAGQYAVAETIVERTYKSRQQIHGREHPVNLLSMGRLSSIYWSQGRWTEAETLGVKVLEAETHIHGEEHQSTLATMHNLAAIYMSQQLWDKAEPLNLKESEICKRTLGENHPSTLSAMSALATTYTKQGHLNKAEMLHMKILETRKQVLGEEHPNTLNSINRLVSIYFYQSRWKEAEETGGKLVETCKRVLGEEHPHTLSCTSDLVSIYIKQEQWEKGKELGKKLLEITERILGEEHPDVLIQKGNLVTIYRYQKQLSEAKALGVETMEACKRVLGEEHPVTLASITNYAWTLMSLGFVQEAIPLASLVLSKQSAKLGSQHPITLETEQSLLASLMSVQIDN